MVVKVETHISSYYSGGTATVFNERRGIRLRRCQASISFVNNKGDIGKTLKELGSSQSVKATIAAALTAGCSTSWAPPAR